MNEQVVPETTGTLTIDAGEYSRIMQRLDRLSAEVEETRALLRKATKNAPERSEWFRKPGMLKGQFEVGPEFFEPMTEDELAEFGIE